MIRQTQDSMLLVGGISGGVFVVAFVALMVIGGYAFSPALFLAIAVAAAVAVFLFVAFHPKVAPPVSAPARRMATGPASGSAVQPRPGMSGAVPTPTMADAGVSRPLDRDERSADGDDAPPMTAAPVSPPQTGEGPARLAAAREGTPDDLKKIKGVGPKLEELLHSMGFYHYDQIASWTADEVAWVDENLEGFKGRVSRDDWVTQARTLASGGETEFSKKVDDGDVY